MPYFDEPVRVVVLIALESLKFVPTQSCQVKVACKSYVATYFFFLFRNYSSENTDEEEFNNKVPYKRFWVLKVTEDVLFFF